MIRLFTKDSTGVAPNGRWFAGDINALQDAVAAILDYTQTIGAGALAIGESGLQLLRFGAGEARVTGHMRVDGILRGLAGLIAGAYTTTARNAIAAGQRPPTMVIWNSTTAQFEYNAGSDAAPNWLPLAPPIGTDTITALELAPNAVTATELAANAVTSAKILDGTIVDADLAADTLTARVIAADSIGTSELAPSSVTTTEIVDGTIATGDIADGAVTSLKIADGTIVDADIAAGALIALTKLAAVLLRGPGSTQYRFTFGSSSGTTNPNTYGPVSFGFAFGAAPLVFILGKTGVGALGDVSDPSTMSVSTTSFTLTCGGAGADAVRINWLAIGVA